MWFTAGLLLAVSLAAGPASAQRLVADVGGSLVWSGDQSVAPGNEPGLLRAGATQAGYQRGYALFRPPDPAFGRGQGPVRLYLYVLDFPAPEQGELALAAYTVAPQFGPRDDSAESGREGGFLWRQVTAGTVLAVGNASALDPPAAPRDPLLGQLSWGSVPSDYAPVDAQWRPVPGWHYLELDRAGSDALREAVGQAQQEDGYLRLALLSRAVEGELVVAGADDPDHEPTLVLGPTCELDLPGEGRVRVNGVEYDLPFYADVPEGAPLTLEALCPQGWEFGGWSGDLSSSRASLSLRMDSPLTLTPHFQQGSCRLQVWASGGHVELDGWYGDLDWARDFPYGTSVHLRAIPDPGYRFCGWGGAGLGSSPWLDLYLNGDCQVWANFERIYVERRVILSLGGAGGYILVNGSRHSLPWRGEVCYGDLVQLIAVPGDGYRFVGWEGYDGSGTIRIRMDGNHQVGAVFRPLPYDGRPPRYDPPRGGYRPPGSRPPEGDPKYGDRPGDQRPGQDRPGDYNPPRGGGQPPDSRPPAGDPRAGDQPGDWRGDQQPGQDRPGDYNPPRGGGSDQPAAPRPPAAQPPPAEERRQPLADQPPQSDPPRRVGGSSQPPTQRPPQAQAPPPPPPPAASANPPERRSKRDNPPPQSDPSRRGGGGSQAAAEGSPAPAAPTEPEKSQPAEERSQPAQQQPTPGQERPNDEGGRRKQRG